MEEYCAIVFFPFSKRGEEKVDTGWDSGPVPARFCRVHTNTARKYAATCPTVFYSLISKIAKYEQGFV